MRVIFMGTPDFAVGTLEAIIEAGHDVALAVTQPDRARGRGKAVQFSPVKETALAHGIEVYQPERIRNPECAEYLRGAGADIIVVAAYGQILPKEILEMAPLGCVNVHASLLPKYRGAAPIQWAVINGERVTGVTIMRMDEGLDTGDMIMQEEVELAPDETGGSLFDKLSEAGASLLVKTLAAIEDGTAVYTPQDHSQATKVGMIKKSMGLIDWEKPAVEIERLIRGLDPWPSAYTYRNGKMLKIWKAGEKNTVTITDLDKKDCKSGKYPTPGTIVEVNKDSIGVQTGDGVLLLTEVQPEGRRRMSCREYLMGYPVSIGDVL